MAIIPFEGASRTSRGQDAKLTRCTLYNGDALDRYDLWPQPDCIIVDGPYGLGKYPGEPLAPDGLSEWYAPHAAAWAKRSHPGTTLWFWNSEIGWAKSHPALELHGWEYQETVIWDKGIAHIAGNVNSKTIRGVPVVTEVAVRYTRRLTLTATDGTPLAAKQWLRAEWARSGLPLYLANEACGVANAATRKYLTQDHVWYFPPGEAVEAMARYCRDHGRHSAQPYFSIDGRHAITARSWDDLRAKWNHTHGQTNVWREPPVHGSERVKQIGSTGYVHANQKPISLLTRQILASTDEGDIVWEPFGGLCSASVAAFRSGRLAHAAEINPGFFRAALQRLRSETALAGTRARNRA